MIFRSLEVRLPEAHALIEDIAAQCVHDNDIENHIRVAPHAAQSADARAAQYGAGMSELSNVAGVSGTTGQRTSFGTPPSGPMEEHGGGEVETAGRRVR